MSDDYPRAEITVDYYEQSGKWFTEETYQIDMPTMLDSSTMYDNRRKLENIILQELKESYFIAVVRYTEDVEDIIGFPMMVK